jgi:ferredoxin
MPAARAVVDHDRCAGVTMCVQTAPGAFAVNDDGQSEYQPGDWAEQHLTDAAEACPMAAITVFPAGPEVR